MRLAVRLAALVVFDPQGTQVNAQFGQVTATANPRVIQLAIRATF